MSTPRAALERAAKNVGGPAHLAKLLSVSRQLVYYWLKTEVPLKRCADVERVSGVPREQLRPDHFRRPTDRAARARAA